MHESHYFIKKPKNGVDFKVLQNDGSWDDTLGDGIWFRSRIKAEKHIEENYKDDDVAVVEVWCQI